MVLHSVWFEIECKAGRIQVLPLEPLALIIKSMMVAAAEAGVLTQLPFCLLGDIQVLPKGSLGGHGHQIHNRLHPHLSVHQHQAV